MTALQAAADLRIGQVDWQLCLFPLSGPHLARVLGAGALRIRHPGDERDRVRADAPLVASAKSEVEDPLGSA